MIGVRRVSIALPVLQSELSVHIARPAPTTVSFAIRGGRSGGPAA